MIVTPARALRSSTWPARTLVTLTTLAVAGAPCAARAEPSASRPPVTASPLRSSTVFVELAAGYVPFANDVPLMIGIGARAFGIHEVWARLGYMPVGDDRRHGFGVLGYRAALRPGKLVRPIVGGYWAALPATCGHDERGRPMCAPTRLFIFAAAGGVRLEPTPWLGFAAQAALGVDTYPNPFGMLELGVVLSPPLGR